MKVSTYKTVEIECEVDVELADVIAELANRTDGKRLMEMLDWLTRILAGIPDEAIEAIKPLIRERICERLMNQARRYDPSP